MERQTTDHIPAHIVGDPFKFQPVYYEWQAGQSIADILQVAGITGDAVVCIDGHAINRDYWHVARPKPGVLITAKVLPDGGDNAIIRSIALIALAVAAPGIGQGIAAFLGSGGLVTTTGGAAALTAISTAAVFAVGVLAINALLPINDNFQNGSADSQSLSVGASRNRIQPFGTFPCLLGRARIYPPQAALPFSELEGNNQNVTMLFVTGYRNMEIEADTERLGEDPITNYTGVELQYDTGGSQDTAGGINLYPGGVFELGVGLKIIEDVYQVRTTQPDIVKASIDLNWLRGIIKYEDDGGRSSKKSRFTYAWRAAGSGGAWNETAIVVKAKTTSVVRKSYEIVFPVKGQYEVAIKGDGTMRDGNGNPPQFNTPTWTVLRSFSEGSVICTDCGAFIGMKIQATEQLSGTPDIFNCIAQSIVPDWDGGAWTPAATNNPASLLRYVLTDPCTNARPLDVSRLDDAAFIAFHEWCSASGFTFNQYIDSNTTVFAVANSIASAGRGRLLTIDGTWTVVIDKPQSIINQYFTPRNTISFSASKVFPEEFHGFRVRFISEVEDWKNSEMIVYRDGWDADTADLLEGFSMVGVTDPDHMWRLTRYFIKSAELQPETFSLEVDIEQLVVTPGDRIAWMEESLLIGLAAARARLDQVGTTIVLDTALDIDIGQADGYYGMTVRSVDGASQTFQVDTPLATPADTFNAPLASGVKTDDLVLFGVFGQIHQDLIVRDILPGPDISATLVCLPYDERIYDVDNEVPPVYDPITTPPLQPGYPVIADIRSDFSVMQPDSGGVLQPTIRVAYEVSGGVNGVQGVVGEWKPSVFDEDTGLILPIDENDSEWIQTVVSLQNGSIFMFPVIQDTYYDVRISFLNDDGTRSQFDSVQHIVVGDLNEPADVPQGNFSVSATSPRLYTWTPDPAGINLAPVAGYEIRYMLTSQAPSVPSIQTTEDEDRQILIEDGTAIPPDDSVHMEANDPTAPDWNQMTKLVDGLIVNQPYESTLPAAADYIFAIKAVSTSGNYSVNASYVQQVVP